MNDEQYRVLNSGRWFAGLPPEFRDALASVARIVVLEAGDRLFLRCDGSDGLYGVLSGAIRFDKLRTACDLMEDLSLYPPRARLVRCLLKLAQGLAALEAS